MYTTILLLSAVLSSAPAARAPVDFRRVFSEDESVTVPEPTPAPLPPAPRPIVKPNIAPKPLRLEIFAPVAAAAQQLECTIYTGEDVHGRGWCTNCIKSHRILGEGDQRLRIIWSTKQPPTGPRASYPQIRWMDKFGDVRRPANSYLPSNLDSLIKLIERSDQEEPVQSSGPPLVYFGVPYFENATGRTSVEHLIQEHGLTWEQLAPYANDPNALDRIHGWKHTGRGRPAYQPVASRRREPREPKAPASGVVGALQGREQIIAAQLWWAKVINEGSPVTIDWTRSGAQIVPLLSGEKVSLVDLIGNMGSVRLSAPGSKLPVQEVEFGYRRLANGKWRITGAVDIDLSEDGKVTAHDGGPVGFIDPVTLGTIWTLIGGAKTAWELFHPVADVTLPGTIKAVATLKGDALGIDLPSGLKIKAKWLFVKIALGMQRVSITPSEIKGFFDGFWIKSRSLKVTQCSPTGSKYQSPSRVVQLPLWQSC